MSERNIIFVPGKNPKPPEHQHRELLWRTMAEGVRRAAPDKYPDFKNHPDVLKLIAWNYLFYHDTRDINRDLPWIDALVNKHEASDEDIREARTFSKRLNYLLYNLADAFPALIRMLPEKARTTVTETNRYFYNENNIACDVRELLKAQLRPLLDDGKKVLLIGHSLGSVIAYDTLWELSHLERLKGKVDLFLTLGSPLGMHYVQRRLQGNEYTGKKRYPTNIKKWVNIASVGDITALDREFADDFHEMLELGVIESIEDHCDRIYNYYRDSEGLNCHRSYGYLVNPVIGKVIADWFTSKDRV